MQISKLWRSNVSPLVYPLHRPYKRMERIRSREVDSCSASKETALIAVATHRSHLYATRIQSKSSHWATSFSHLRLSLPAGFFQQKFRTKISYMDSYLSCVLHVPSISSSFLWSPDQATQKWPTAVPHCAGLRIPALWQLRDDGNTVRYSSVSIVNRLSAALSVVWSLAEGRHFPLLQNFQTSCVQPPSYILVMFDGGQRAGRDVDHSVLLLHSLREGGILPLLSYIRLCFVLKDSVTFYV